MEWLFLRVHSVKVGLIYSPITTAKDGKHEQSVSTYESDEPKIGRRHLAMEGNALNNFVGSFTLGGIYHPRSWGRGYPQTQRIHTQSR